MVRVSTLEEILGPQIELTIDGLKRKRFTPDPISGKYYSKIASLIGSACKRHGFILERAILEQLKTCPRFEVWEDKLFHVTDPAEHIVDTIFGTPDRAMQTTTDYSPHGRRTLQLDAIVYDRERKTLGAYEIKRGAGSRFRETPLHPSRPPLHTGASEVVWRPTRPRGCGSSKSGNFLLRKMLDQKVILAHSAGAR